jgi:hypothetical protein
VAATKTMIKRTEETQGLKPKRLVADTGYGTRGPRAERSHAQYPILHP